LGFKVVRGTKLMILDLYAAADPSRGDVLQLVFDEDE